MGVIHCAYPSLPILSWILELYKTVMCVVTRQSRLDYHTIIAGNCLESCIAENLSAATQVSRDEGVKLPFGFPKIMGVDSSVVYKRGMSIDD